MWRSSHPSDQFYGGPRKAPTKVRATAARRTAGLMTKQPFLGVQNGFTKFWVWIKAIELQNGTMNRWKHLSMSWFSCTEFWRHLWAMASKHRVFSAVGMEVQRVIPKLAIICRKFSKGQPTQIVMSGPSRFRTESTSKQPKWMGYWIGSSLLTIQPPRCILLLGRSPRRNKGPDHRDAMAKSSREMRGLVIWQRIGGGRFRPQEGHQNKRNISRMFKIMLR